MMVDYVLSQVLRKNPMRIFDLLCVSAGILVASGCNVSSSEKILDSKPIFVGKLLVDPRPSAELFVDSRSIGHTPLVVPICAYEQTVMTKEFNGHLLPLWPLYATQYSLATGLMGADSLADAFGCSEEEVAESLLMLTTRKKQRRVVKPSVTLELRRDGYVSQTLVVNPDAIPSAWRPRLLAIASEPLVRPEQPAVRQADDLRSASEAASTVRRQINELGEFVDELNETCRQAVETRKKLLTKEY